MKNKLLWGVIAIVVLTTLWGIVFFSEIRILGGEKGNTEIQTFSVPEGVRGPAPTRNPGGTSPDPIVVGPQDPIVVGPQDPIVVSPQDPIVVSPQDPIVVSPQDPIVVSPDPTDGGAGDPVPPNEDDQ